MAATTTLAQGSSVTLTVTATDSLLIDGARDASAIVEAVSGVPGAANRQRIVNHPGGQATYGPFGAGTVQLSAIGGAIAYSQGAAPIDDEPQDVKYNPTSQSLVSGDGTLLSLPLQASVEDLGASVGRTAGVFYPLTSFVSGTDLAESGNKAVNITAAGTTAGVHANAGWFTHHGSGNTLQLKNDAYIDAITDMTTEGEILIGCDFYCTTWPSATETLWSIGRPTDTGGVRMPLTSGGPGTFAIYYRPTGAGSETIIASYAMASGYTTTRLSILVKLRMLPTLNQLHSAIWINGRMEASNVSALGVGVTPEALSGLNFSGHGNTPAQKLGTSGTGVRTANAFCMRHGGADQNIAGRLAKAIYTNTALPSWLARI